MLAMGPRDLNSAPYSPVRCSSHSMTSFQSSERTELRVVENSQLFAQRAHNANYYGDYPGNNPENHPPAESCTIQNSKIQTSDACHGSQGPKFCPL